MEGRHSCLPSSFHNLPNPSSAGSHRSANADKINSTEEMSGLVHLKGK
jgi:hypothetical protein